MSPIPRIGTEFAGYRIEALLGRGGMGVVYRAEHPRLGARIALKILAPELADDETFRERFVRESRLAASISHPNIITIYDAGEWLGALYIAMRYVEGGDLRLLLRREGVLSLARTSAIVSQVGGALDAAHAQGLVHRDVKPANVLLQSSTGRTSPELAYLADFGLTKRTSSALSPTTSGALLGTIDYIAPEQIEDKAVDGRADVYSLGCVVFECLTGSAPFARESDAATLWAHMHDVPPRPSQLRPALPVDVDAVVARALAKDPDDRSPSGWELAMALSDIPAARGATTATLAKVDTFMRAEAPIAADARPDADGMLHARVRGSRWRWLAGAAVGLMLGAVGGVAVFAAAVGEQKRAETFTVTSTSTVTAAATSSLKPNERALLSHIPPGVEPTCHPARPLTRDFDASLSCQPSSGALVVRYNHARSASSLGDHFVSRVARAGVPIPQPGGRVKPTGNCNEDAPGVNDWLPLGLVGHEEAEPGDATELRRGRVLCHKRGARSWIEWTFPRLRIYSFVHGKSFDKVYAWWATQSGPL